MAKRIVEESSLTRVADAIRAKTGTTDEIVFPDGFEEAVNNIQAGGGYEESLISVCEGSPNNATNIELPEGLTKVRDDLFKNYSELTSMELPSTLTSIGTPSYIASDAFWECGVDTINVPWSEGEVEGAPWGSSAEIVYDYTG